jgi:hydroxymethylpyrimidine/phosphomethylpyrimidine kinase
VAALAFITKDSIEMRSALTIAGSDSGGGAGIQADLKTFAAHGVFGTCAVTAVTAQNTLGVTLVEVLSPAMVAAQIDAVASDLFPAATKLGMLASADIVRTAAEQSRGIGSRTSSWTRHGGQRRFTAHQRRCDRGHARRAVAACGSGDAECARSRGADRTAHRLRSGHATGGAPDCRLGAKAVLVKGGHLEGAATDVLWSGGRMIELTEPRVDTRHTHGTGCTLSAAIAARLALGDALEDAVRAAKHYVTLAIRQAPALGKGHGPLQHFRIGAPGLRRPGLKTRPSSILP